MSKKRKRKVRRVSCVSKIPLDARPGDRSATAGRIGGRNLPDAILAAPRAKQSLVT